MLSLLVLLACGPRVPVSYDVGGADPDWAALRRDGVAVAPVTLVRDLPAPPLPPQPPPGRVEQGLEDTNLPAPTALDPERDGPFLRNDFVGSVRFGGGLIRTGDVALEVRARIIELAQQDTYAEVGTRWLSEAVGAALAERGVAAWPVELNVAPPPERIPHRGLHEEDGHDNLNLPRSTLAPAPLPEAGRGEGWVLVPYLRSYYSHNGGWFLGQQYGCMAGARVETMLVLYDAATGRPAWWMNATGRYIHPSRGQPNRAEQEQFLIWAEDQVEEALRKGLFR